MIGIVRRLLLLAIALVCGASVGLRIYLSLVRLNLDHSLAWRLFEEFSYFTITTNLLVAAVAVGALRRPASPLARPSVIAATAVYIFVVGVTYALLLKASAHPSGLGVFTDFGMHEAMPVLFILYWLLFTPKAQLRWTQPVGWLIYPGVYIFYTLVRGAVIGRYPYPFADVTVLGYPGALRNAVVFMAVFYGLGLLAVGLGRLEARTVLFRFAARRVS